MKLPEAPDNFTNNPFIRHKTDRAPAEQEEADTWISVVRTCGACSRLRRHSTVRCPLLTATGSLAAALAESFGPLSHILSPLRAYEGSTLSLTPLILSTSTRPPILCVFHSPTFGFVAVVLLSAPSLSTMSCAATSPSPLSASSPCHRPASQSTNRFQAHQHSANSSCVNVAPPPQCPANRKQSTSSAHLHHSISVGVYVLAVVSHYVDYGVRRQQVSVHATCCTGSYCSVDQERG